MKKLILSFIALLAVNSFAVPPTPPPNSCASSLQSLELFGHWPAEHFTSDKVQRYYTVDYFGFETSDRKIGQFLDCAFSKYPKNDIYLEGIRLPYPHEPLVTTAYICLSGPHLKICPEQDKKWLCP